MSLKLWGVGLLLLASAFAFLRLDTVATERDAAEQRAAALQAQVDEKDAEAAQLMKALEGQQDRAARLLEVERGIQTLRQTLDMQGDAQRANFEELKRNDQTVRDYLRRSVPDALGVRYERPDTTNPAAYYRPRAPAMPTDPVSAPGAPSHSNE